MNTMNKKSEHDHEFLRELDEMQGVSHDESTCSHCNPDYSEPPVNPNNHILSQGGNCNGGMLVNVGLNERELQVLLTFWLTEYVATEMFTFLTCCTGGSEMRCVAEAAYRSAMLSELLSEKARSEAMDEAEAAFRKKYGDVWDVFKSTLKPGVFSGEADVEAIKRSFCSMVSQLPAIGLDCDTDGYSNDAEYYCLGAAMKALRGCWDVMPSLQYPVEIPVGSLYSVAVSLVEEHMKRWCDDCIARQDAKDAAAKGS